MSIWTSLLKIWKACSYEFNAIFLTFWALHSLLQMFTQFCLFTIENAYVPEAENEGGKPLPLVFQYLIFMV